MIARVQLIQGSPAIWCPGCNLPHVFNSPHSPAPQTHSVWHWDGNSVAPTINPSLHLQRRIWVGPDPDPHNEADPYDLDNWDYLTVCHVTVKHGRLFYSRHCPHPFAGQVIDVPLWPSSNIRPFSLPATHYQQAA